MRHERTKLYEMALKEHEELLNEIMLFRLKNEQLTVQRDAALDGCNAWNNAYDKQEDNTGVIPGAYEASVLAQTAIDMTPERDTSLVEENKKLKDILLSLNVNESESDLEPCWCSPNWDKKYWGHSDKCDNAREALKPKE